MTAPPLSERHDEGAPLSRHQNPPGKTDWHGSPAEASEMVIPLALKNGSRSPPTPPGMQGEPSQG